MLYKNYVLEEIYAYGDDCRTSTGIRMGDSQTEVEGHYGKGKRKVVNLRKGKHDVLGPIGDYVLEYSGVEFVIVDRKITGMFILRRDKQ